MLNPLKNLSNINKSIFNKLMEEIMIIDLVNKISNRVIEKFKNKNKEFIEMKIVKEETENFILGRTFSLGQWFGYYLGMEISNELPKYTILVDTCLTTIKKYEIKSVNSNSKNKEKRKSFYPDILILKEINRKLMDEELPFKYENKKLLRRDKLNIYEVVAIIELKIDPGYIDINRFNESMDNVNKYIKNKEGFTFDRLSKIPQNNGMKTKVVKEKNIVCFDSKSIEKAVILATEANHSERIEEIKKVCNNNDFIYISLTDNKEHIRHVEW